MQAEVNFRPYVSVDLETTGLQKGVHVLQVAAVYDDLKTPVAELPKFNLAIKYDTFTVAEPFALFLNAKLIEKIAKAKADDMFVRPAKEVCEAFCAWLSTFKPELEAYDDKFATKMKGKICFAGKNVAAADVPWLEGLMLDTGMDKDFGKLKIHRTLDVGSMYYPDFGFNASLSDINKLSSRPEVSHDALDDALDVVVAIRNKLGIKC